MNAARAFVAVAVPPAVGEDIDRLQRELAARWPAPAVRWVPTEQLHLTLVFLGQVAGDRLGDLQTVLSRACQSLAPFSLRAETSGCFPNARRPRILWVGLTGDAESLGQLQSRVAAAAVPFADHVEDRPFRPHLTIARIKPTDPDALRGIGQRLSRGPALAAGAWRVEAVDLMRSDLSPAGAVYHRLASFPLGG